MTADREVVTRFNARVAQAVADHRELCMAVHNKRNQASLDSLLAEQLALSVAIAWEDFVTDLLIAYMSRSPKTMLEDLKARMRKSSTDRFGAEATRAIRFGFPAKPKPLALELLVDPKGWNVAVSSAQSLSQKANQLLPAEFARKFSLDADDSAFVDLLLALRNYLAHRSKASRGSLKAAIAAMVGSRNAPLGGAITTVAAYLKAFPIVGDSRATLIAKRVMAIANKL